jgi:hypothetical protein
MSYLGPLRLHFSGRFQAAVSTVNNDPHHYDSTTFTSADQELEDPSIERPNEGWWNPRGDADWRLIDCAITSAFLPDGSATPSSDPIPFDPTQIYPLPVNPKAESYPPGSAARHACDTFNYTYTSLLKVLHETFNGDPNILPTSVSVMESLNEQAQTMARMDSETSGNVGPSFEYRPTNP